MRVTEKRPITKPLVVKLNRFKPGREEVQHGYAFLYDRYLPHLRSGTVGPEMVHLVMDLKWRPQAAVPPVLGITMCMPGWVSLEEGNCRVLWEVFEAEIKNGVAIRDWFHWVGMEMTLGQQFNAVFVDNRGRQGFHTFSYRSGNEFLMWPVPFVEVIPENAEDFQKNPALVEQIKQVK